MKILLAKDAGYCFGVRDAVNLAYDTAEQNGDVYMLGHIVHNENVVQDLDSAGAKVINSLDDRSEEHTSELQSRTNLVCRLLLEKKKIKK